MRRWILLGVTLIVTAACTDAAVTTTIAAETTDATATSAPATTVATTDPTDECREIAEDAADLLVDIVDALGGIDPSRFTDPALWPDELVELQADGEVLDSQAAEAGCDVGAIQARALEEAADLEPRNRIAELLLELLGVGERP